MILGCNIANVTWYGVTISWEIQPVQDYLVILLESSSDRKTDCTQIHYRGCKRQAKVVGLFPEAEYHFSLFLIDRTKYVAVLSCGDTESNITSETSGTAIMASAIDKKDIHFKTLKCGVHDTKLISAIHSHNLDEIKRICQERPDMVNIPDNAGISPLMHAAQRGYPSIIRILYDYGANIDYTNPGGKTSLMFAAFYGNAHVVATLMELGCDWSKQDNVGNTALHYSIEQGDLDISMDLIKLGADVNQKDSRGYSSLMNLCISEREDDDILRFLLKQGMNPNEKLPSGETPLMAAVRNEKVQSLKILLEFGAKHKLTTKYGYTALQMCLIGSECHSVLLNS